MDADQGTDARRRVRLVGPTAELAYPISPRLTLYDIVEPAEIDGDPGVGYAEMAWPPDYLAANTAANTEEQS